MSLPQSDVLLLHGALGASIQFVPLQARLGGRFRAHALDFEGHGQAPARGRPFRIEHFAENVVEHLDRERLERAFIFGYSMGGYVALHLARTRPERVAGVLTLGTKLRWSADVAAGEARLLDPNAIRERVPRFAGMLAERHPAGWEAVLERTAELLHELGERPLLGAADFAAISCPVRLAVGDRDTTVSIDECVEAYRMLPRGELEVHPGTPHPWEKVAVERVARALEELVT